MPTAGKHTVGRQEQDFGASSFINVFLNEDNIRDKNELETAVKSGDTISILPSIAGG